MTSLAKRIPSLDGLRAISILLVLVSHFINSLGYNDPLVLGNLGVRVFFVISGFLITGLLLKEWDERHQIDLAKFYFRRTLRIFPPYYFFLAVMGLASLGNWIEIPWRAFVVAFTYTSNYLPTSNWDFAHSWSLSVEEQFYLIFPGLLALLGRRRAFILLCAVLVVSPPIRVACYYFFSETDPGWLVEGFHSNMDALATGCCLAFARTRLHRSPLYLRLVNSQAIWLLLAVALLANVQVQHPNIYYLACISLMNFAIVFVVDRAVLSPNGKLGTVLNSRPLVVLGMMSYSIYLWQQPFMNRGSELRLASNAINLVWMLLFVAISYFIVERYSLSLRQKLEVRLFSRKRSTGVSGVPQPEVGTTGVMETA